MTLPPAETIHDLVLRIDDVVAWSRERKSRVGFFAALYRHVAVAFEKAIAQGIFRYPEQMERLDVVFFNRYLAAYDDLVSDRKPTASWAVAFEATTDERPVVVQHLCLGMNAHIDFDLGIAVAEAVPKELLPAFEPDFLRMNQLLASLLHVVLSDLSLVWPALATINHLFSWEEELIVNFSMKTAREIAWRNATTLAAMSPDERKAEIQRMDAFVAWFGHEIWKPGFAIEALLAIVRAGEVGDVDRQITDLLRDDDGSAAAHSEHVATRALERLEKRL